MASRKGSKTQKEDETHTDVILNTIQTLMERMEKLMVDSSNRSERLENLLMNKMDKLETDVEDLRKKNALLKTKLTNIEATRREQNPNKRKQKR